MSPLLDAIISFSILIPALVGVIRRKAIAPSYRPFVLLLWVGLFNELVSFFLIHSANSNTVTNNVYYLVESVIILYQFRRWRLFERARKLYYAILCLFIGAWVVENLWLRSMSVFSSFYIVFYSFLLTLMSISMLNKLLVSEKKALYKNSIFLICVGFIIYFTYAVLIEAFYLYGMFASIGFQKGVLTIMIVINFLTNLLFALSVLWMPKKQEFTRLS